MTFRTLPLDFPVLFGYCDDPKDWEKLVKKHNLADNIFVNAGCAASCNSFQPVDDCLHIIVCVNRRARKFKNRSSIAAALAHECVHAWNRLCRQINEKEPGDEISAYLIERMVGFCMDSFYKKD